VASDKLLKPLIKFASDITRDGVFIDEGGDEKYRDCEGSLGFRKRAPRTGAGAKMQRRQ
jgi:hypothetical protein